VPTVTGLQRELQDLRVIISHLAENQEQLRQENITLRGSLEVLQALKEKMLVSVPALEAEMRGLRNGMELEKTKEEVEILHAQLEATNRRLAQFEDEESSGEESEEVEDSETNHQAP
jgi:RNA polymerase-interacting CarD/CdnL/TRCF family regulator